MGFEERLQRALVKGIHAHLDTVYHKSQELVPVQTGTLRRSGRVSYLRDGGTVSYSTPYARVIEYGEKAHWERVPYHLRKAHKRQVPHYLARRRAWSSGTGPYPRRRWQRIPRQEVNSYWRRVPNRKGQYFLLRATQQTAAGFSQSLIRALKQEFGSG